MIGEIMLTKLARQVWGGRGEGGGRDPPGVTLQRMLLKEL